MRKYEAAFPVLFAFSALSVSSVLSVYGVWCLVLVSVLAGGWKLATGGYFSA